MRGMKTVNIKITGLPRCGKTIIASIINQALLDHGMITNVSAYGSKLELYDIDNMDKSALQPLLVEIDEERME